MADSPDGNGALESFLTIKQLMAWLNVGERTVWDWMAKRGFPARRFGGVLRFDPAEVRAWMDRERASKAV